MATARLRVEALFLIVGAGMLAAAAYAYLAIVVRPASWPRADALIVSSRIVNPGGPSSYSPELVFRLGSGDAPRDVTVAPSWSSSSYGVVRGHLDRFPAGQRVTVAVNPADPDDVRYDLTLSMSNLLIPGVLGLIGLVFTVTGMFALRAARPAGERSPPVPPSTGEYPGSPALEVPPALRRFPPIFAAIGAVIAIVGVMVARSDLAMLREWPRIEAGVLESTVVTHSSTGRGSKVMYDTSVTFRYVVKGVTYENSTTYGIGSSNRSSAAARAEAYAPGTVHSIWHRPGDPNLIRFDLGNPFAVFMLPGGLVLMGLVFMTFGGLVWRSISRPATVPGTYLTNRDATDGGPRTSDSE